MSSGGAASGAILLSGGTLTVLSGGSALATTVSSGAIGSIGSGATWIGTFVNVTLYRPGGHSNLVLDYDSGSSVGKSMRRGETRSFPCSHAVAILKFVSASDYYVLTSYPDCWKQQ